MAKKIEIYAADNSSCKESSHPSTERGYAIVEGEEVLFYPNRTRVVEAIQTYLGRGFNKSIDAALMATKESQDLCVINYEGPLNGTSIYR